MSLLDNLVSYWMLNEANGTRSDSHAGNHLADNNTVTSQAGILGNAAEFLEANSEYLSIEDAAQTGLDVGTSDFSVQSWVYPSNASNTLLAKRETGTGIGWELQLDGSRRPQTRIEDAGGETQVQATTALPLNAWSHVVWTFDRDGNLEVYLNGSVLSFFASKDISSRSDSLSSSVRFTLGTYLNPAASRRFSGRLDEVGIWTRVLSSAEVTQLYNGGAGLAYPFAVGNPHYYYLQQQLAS